MAEGLMRSLFGEHFDVFSAGTEATFVKPMAIRVMAESGIDLSGHRSKTIGEFKNHRMDYVVTVCDSARETCPFFPATERNVYHGFVDPSGETRSEHLRLQAFRMTRDDIETWLLNTFG